MHLTPPTIKSERTILLINNSLHTKLNLFRFRKREITMSYFSNPLSFFTIEWKDGAKIQEILSSIYTRLHRCLLWTSCSGETAELMYDGYG